MHERLTFEAKILVRFAELTLNSQKYPGIHHKYIYLPNFWPVSLYDQRF